jgi:hypothetical protein
LRWGHCKPSDAVVGASGSVLPHRASGHFRRPAGNSGVRGLMSPSWFDIRAPLHWCNR